MENHQHPTPPFQDLHQLMLQEEVWVRLGLGMEAQSTRDSSDCAPPHASVLPHTPGLVLRHGVAQAMTWVSKGPEKSMGKGNSSPLILHWARGPVLDKGMMNMLLSKLDQ